MFDLILNFLLSNEKYFTGGFIGVINIVFGLLVLIFQSRIKEDIKHEFDVKLADYNKEITRDLKKYEIHLSQFKQLQIEAICDLYKILASFDVELAKDNTGFSDLGKVIEIADLFLKRYRESEIFLSDKICNKINEIMVVYARLILIERLKRRKGEEIDVNVIDDLIIKMKENYTTLQDELKKEIKTIIDPDNGN